VAVEGNKTSLVGISRLRSTLHSRFGSAAPCRPLRLRRTRSHLSRRRP